MINWTEPDKLLSQENPADSMPDISRLSFLHWRAVLNEGVLITDEKDSFFMKDPKMNPYDDYLVWNSSESRAVKITGPGIKRTYASSAGIKFYWIKIPFGFMASHSWDFTFRDMDRGVGICFLSHVKIGYCFAALR